MALHKIKKGLSLPITGEPEQVIGDGAQPSRVALVAGDYHGMRPTMHVQVGDSVRRGQLLFEDKKTPGVRFTAIASGRVAGVNRGAKRALQSVVIDLDEEERSGRGSTVRFSADSGKHPSSLSEDQVRDLLVESGLWTAFRTRPFSKVADPETRPRSIFVTAADSNPLAPDPAVVLQGRGDDFERGLAAIAKLAEDAVYICTGPGVEPQVPKDGNFRVEQFAGPHPSGTAGVHIHTLDPVDRKKLVWYLGYQDVLSIGRLFERGELDVSRVISLAGPAVDRPRLIRTRVGVATDDLVKGEVDAAALDGGHLRLISGSVLSGRTAQGAELGFLGRYHNQLSVLREDRERELLGWMGPGASKFSTLNLFLSRLMPGKKFDFTTTTNGSDRAIVPLGLYERVFPIDIPATFLLKAVVVGDIERAEELGIYELDEEDLALCSFVDPGKHDFGAHLRDLLTTIEKEG